MKKYLVLSALSISVLTHGAFSSTSRTAEPEANWTWGWDAINLYQPPSPPLKKPAGVKTKKPIKPMASKPSKSPSRSSRTGLNTIDAIKRIQPQALSSWPWVAALSIGPIWEKSGQTQTISLAPEVEKTYTTDDALNTLAEGSFFIGLQKPLQKQLQSQLGLAVGITSQAKMSGHIWDDADPQFDNHTYNYQIEHTHLLLQGKILVEGYAIIPWLSGGAGIGFNKAQSFQNTPTLFEALPNNNFTSNTTTTFTYTISAGIQKSLSKNWQIGIGYEFADWGDSQLGRAPEQVLNGGLGLNHLYTNGLLFNLTYIA